MTTFDQAVAFVKKHQVQSLRECAHNLIPIINDHRDPYYEGRTLLQIACAVGYVDIVELLLNISGIDVNKSLNREPPLFLACERGHLEIVKLLLGVPGIDVNRGRGKTPLYVACEMGFIEIVDLLLNASDTKVNRGRGRIKTTPLHVACLNG